MRYGLAVVTVAVCVLSVLFGCEDKAGTKTHSWPMTKEQLAKLRKMPRAERDEWFAKMSLPDYGIRRRQGEIKVDGVLDEAAWKKANPIKFVGVGRGGKVRLDTTMRALWDDDALYLAYECEDPDVHNPLSKRDDPLWKHDLVEVFIDANCDSTSYMELHVAASGATADMFWANFRPDADWFANPTWKVFKPSSTCYDIEGMTSAVKVDGSLNNPDDTDKGYVVEWRIPFAEMVNIVPDEQKGKKLIEIAAFKTTPIEMPKVGTVWRVNFVRCDDSTGVKKKNKKGELVNVCQYSAWTPTTGTCHMPFLFGRAKFID